MPWSLCQMVSHPPRYTKWRRDAESNGRVEPGHDLIETK